MHTYLAGAMLALLPGVCNAQMTIGELRELCADVVADKEEDNWGRSRISVPSVRCLEHEVRVHCVVQDSEDFDPFIVVPEEDDVPPRAKRATR